MKEQWQELKETIIEIRDNNAFNEDVYVMCRFLINYMGVLEEQIQEPCEYAPFTIEELKDEDTQKLLREFKQELILDKIKAEIMQLDYDTEYIDYHYNDMVDIEEVHTICREEVLRIIDKYTAESEG